MMVVVSFRKAVFWKDRMAPDKGQSFPGRVRVKGGIGVSDKTRLFGCFVLLNWFWMAEDLFNKFVDDLTNLNNKQYSK